MRSVKGASESVNSIFRITNQEKLRREIKMKESNNNLSIIKRIICSKLFLNINNEENFITPDTDKFFEIQNIIGKNIVSLFINSEDFIELDEQYNSGKFV